MSSGVRGAGTTLLARDSHAHSLPGHHGENKGDAGLSAFPAYRLPGPQQGPVQTLSQDASVWTEHSQCPEARLTGKSKCLCVMPCPCPAHKSRVVWQRPLLTKFTKLQENLREK